MTWVRLEDRFPWHRKVRRLSDPAFRLHVSALCWVTEHLTNGHVPRADLARISDVSRPNRAVSQLVLVGIWDVTDDGWYIHDYLEYHPSAEQVKAKRAELSAKRAEAGRIGGLRSAEERSKQSKQTGKQVADDLLQAKRSPVPSRPDPYQNNELQLLAQPRLSEDDFDRFWETYPRRVGKQGARAAYARAIKKVSPAVIQAGAERYANDPTRDPAYTAHPQTWLNNGRWDDEGPVRPASAAPNKADERTARNLSVLHAIAAREQHQQPELGAS